MKRLALFRMFFGVFMFAHVADLWLSGALSYYFVLPSFHFKYPGLSWLAIPDEFMVMAAFCCIGLAALILALGVYSRLMAAIIAVLYGYFLLADASFFKHHHYLFALLALLLTFIRTDFVWALKNNPRASSSDHISLGLFLLRFQMVVPYFFGGLSKLANVDWTSGETATMILQTNFTDSSIMLWLTPAMTYGGLIFDLTIGGLLFLKRTRPLAFLLIALFNTANLFLFNIDVFPLVMMASCVLFLGSPKEFPKELWQLRLASISFPTKALAIAYLVIQLFVPLRHYVIPGDVFWTGEGYMMGWNMIDSLKRNRIRFTVSDSINKLKYDVEAEDHLTSRQRGTLARFPEFAPQAARFIASKAALWNISNPTVSIAIEVSKNGREFAPVVYPTSNLSDRHSKVLTHDDWIIPTERIARELSIGNQP